MKKHLLFYWLFLFFSNVFFSQTKIDSALNMIDVDSIHDSTKIPKLYKAAVNLLINPDSTIKLLDIGLKK